MFPSSRNYAIGVSTTAQLARIVAHRAAEYLKLALSILVLFSFLRTNISPLFYILYLRWLSSCIILDSKSRIKVQESRIDICFACDLHLRLSGWLVCFHRSQRLCLPSFLAILYAFLLSGSFISFQAFPNLLLLEAVTVNWFSRIGSEGKLEFFYSLSSRNWGM